MKKYYLSHIDFSEIVNVTADTEQLDRAKERMTELGLLTEKGNPATGVIGTMTKSTSRQFFIKLEKRTRRRAGGVTAVRDTLRKLCDRKDYYGVFLYVAFLYGFLEWQVPERVMLLPAVPEALKCYCTELIDTFDDFLEETSVAETEDITVSEKERNDNSDEEMA